MYSTYPQKITQTYLLVNVKWAVVWPVWPVCTFVQPQPFNAAEGFSPQAESTEPGCPCRGVVCKWSGLEDLLSVAGYAVSVISNDCRDLWWNSFFPFYVLSHLKNRGRVETSDMANHNLLLMQIYYSTFKNGKDEMKNLHQMYDNSRPHLLMMEHRGGY